jgi:hypothetical protein
VNYPARRTSRKLSGREAMRPTYKERYGSNIYYKELEIHRKKYRKHLTASVVDTQYIWNDVKVVINNCSLNFV